MILEKVRWMMDPTPPAMTTPPTALVVSFAQVLWRFVVLTYWRAWLSDNARINV
jgi:hypothetical protein